MKKYIWIVALAVSNFGISLHAQMGGSPAIPQFGNGMEKLFGDNQTFSATMEMQVSAGGSPMTMSGQMSFDKGNSRVEMDMSAMKGGAIPSDAMTMMKSAGLDKMVTISQADKKVVYVIYPNAQAYAEMSPPAPDAGATNMDSKVETTELGKEMVDGHPCVKNKAVVTDKQGAQHEFTIWNATDLKKFPIKLAMNEQGNDVTTFYRNISFAKPAASLFIPPVGYTKYNSVQELMQTLMMKNMSAPQPPQ